jgi:hypothetical protein
MRKWRRDNPGREAKSGPRVAARAVARQSKLRGRLKIQPCVICGAPRAEMHHVDYEKPLDVTWLCATHHKAWHTLWRTLVFEQFEQWVASEHRRMAASRVGKVP